MEPRTRVRGYDGSRTVQTRARLDLPRAATLFPCTRAEASCLRRCSRPKYSEFPNVLFWIAAPRAGNAYPPRTSTLLGDPPMTSPAGLIETLEARTFLSTVELTDRGVLRIVGDDNVDDVIVLGVSGEQVSVVVNGG